MSGHGHVIGAHTGNIIGFMVKSKSGSTFKLVNRMSVGIEEHKCNTNWEGASGTMEAGVALELFIILYEGDYAIHVKVFVSDNASNMRVNLVHCPCMNEPHL